MIKRATLFFAFFLIVFGASLCDAAIPTVFRVPTSNKVIALTFDDGPNERYTEQFLEVLRSEGVLASFFLLGKNVESHPKLVKKIEALGHDIGNHSYQHKSYLKLSSRDRLVDLAKSQRAFKSILGVYPKFFRPPFGDVSLRIKRQLAPYFESTVLWDVDSSDSNMASTSKDIKNAVLQLVKPGSIILCHDNNDLTLRALKPIIKTLKRSGYRFITLSELIGGK
ncbi:MAG: peptidoglycan/xylan/chitin deacetylase (PgdA/CDA1 family) [Candidatus Marinamargulisbacteria bacterium]